MLCKKIESFEFTINTISQHIYSIIVLHLLTIFVHAMQA
jgi:hypothetical protein